MIKAITIIVIITNIIIFVLDFLETSLVSFWFSGFNNSFLEISKILAKLSIVSSSVGKAIQFSHFDKF